MHSAERIAEIQVSGYRFREPEASGQNAARPYIASGNWPDKNLPWFLKAESRIQDTKYKVQNMSTYYLYLITYHLLPAFTLYPFTGGSVAAMTAMDHERYEGRNKINKVNSWKNRLILFSFPDQ